jgi:ABC-type Fe3+-hydroxamate transport system substrate-binding protein
MTLGRLAVVVLALAGCLGAQPRRIVSTAPSITEMLFALGLGDRVVGVTTFCRYPEAAKKIAKVGTYIQPNLEVILSLKPDLVVIQENPARLKEKFEAVRLNVLELQHTTVDDVIGAMEVLGKATGAEKRAADLNAATRADLDAIRQKTATLPKRRLMFIVGRTPSAIEGLIAVGKASYLNELIAIAGGVNIFADSMSPYPKVSLEEVLARNPEVIVDMGEMAETVGVTDEQKRRVEQMWQRYANIAAVKRGGVHAVASDIYVVPGPRMVDAARAFARMLHPEAGF